MTDYKPKPIRIETPGAARFITFSCYKRQHLFNHKHLSQLFLDCLIQSSQKDKIDIWAYVIMSNHIHLLLYAAREVSVRSYLAKLKADVARNALHWLDKTQPDTYNNLKRINGKRVQYRFWQHGGGYDRSLWTMNLINRAIEYIHGNPLRAGLVDDPVNYKWSSAKEWEMRNFKIINPENYFDN